VLSLHLTDAHRHHAKWRAGLALVLAVAAALTAIGFGAASASPAHAAAAKPVLTFGITETQTNLNPAKQPSGGTITSLAYDSLTRLTPGGQIAPELATSWHYVGSGTTTFQLTLRRGVRFSDGSPLDASAVKAWISYFLRADGPFTKIIPLRSVTTSGNWTVAFHLSAPDPDVAYQLIGGNINIGFIGSPKAAANPSSLGAQTDGAGPYVAVPSQSVAGSVYTFVPNKYYYDPAAIHYSKIVAKIITQPSTMLAAIESGQVDVAAGDVTTAKAAAAAGLDVIKSPTGWGGLLLTDRSPKMPNSTAPNPLGNVKVRQALNYAIDRASIAKALLPGSGTATSEARTLDGYVPSYAHFYAYDPTKARALLAAAGYAHGFTLNLISQTSFGTLGDPMVQAIAQNLSAVGVKVNVTSEPTIDGWVAAYEAEKYVASGFISFPFIPMYQFYGYYLAPKEASSIGSSDDPTMDKLYEQGLNAKDPGQYWQAMSRRMVAQAEEVPVLEFDSFWYANKQVGGVVVTPENGNPVPSDWFPR
jgi:peptide/nickel transport system substrate-binding protein